MKLVQPILDNIEAVLTWIARHGLGADLPAYCQLETAIGLDPDDPQAKQQAALDPKGARPTILITRQCAMLTVFELAGSMDVVGDAEFERITGDLQRALAAYFQRTGHSIEITFERDPQRMADTARRLMESAYQTCARIGLDLEDMLDARCERIAALCAHEVCYVLLYTHLSALGPEAFKREMKAHQARIKACKIEPTISGAPSCPAIPIRRATRAILPMTISISLSSRRNSVRDGSMSRVNTSVSTASITAPPRWNSARRTFTTSCACFIASARRFPGGFGFRSSRAASRRTNSSVWPPASSDL